jgi:hypothetical protein
MRLVVKTIPQARQEYSTLGDWRPNGAGAVNVFVTEMADSRHEFLIALHELIEWRLCEERGIPEPTVRAFDLAHPDADEPGSLEEAPYHREHMFAEWIERLVAFELGVNWQDYEAACEAVFEEVSSPPA